MSLDEPLIESSLRAKVEKAAHDAAETFAFYLENAVRSDAFRYLADKRTDAELPSTAARRCRTLGINVSELFPEFITTTTASLSAGESTGSTTPSVGGTNSDSRPSTDDFDQFEPMERIRSGSVRVMLHNHIEPESQSPGTPPSSAQHFPVTADESNRTGSPIPPIVGGDVLFKGYHSREEKMLGGMSSGQYTPPLPHRSFGALTRRYFVVRRDFTVDVYKSKSEYDARKAPKGSKIVLAGYTLHPDASLSITARADELRCLPSKEAVPHFSFPTIELVCGTSRRAYYFSFDSPEDHATWVKVYQCCIDNAWRVCLAPFTTITSPEDILVHNAFNRAMMWTRAHLGNWEQYGGQTLEYKDTLKDLITLICASTVKSALSNAITHNHPLSPSVVKTAEKLLFDTSIAHIVDKIVSGHGELSWYSLEKNVRAVHKDVRRVLDLSFSGIDGREKLTKTYTAVTMRVQTLVELKLSELGTQGVVAMMRNMDTAVRAGADALRGLFTSWLAKLADGRNAERWYHDTMTQIQYSIPRNYSDCLKCVFCEGMSSDALGAAFIDTNSSAEFHPVFSALLSIAVGLNNAMRTSPLLQKCSRQGQPLDGVLMEVTDDALRLLCNAVQTTCRFVDAALRRDTVELVSLLDRQLVAWSRRCHTWMVRAVFEPVFIHVVLDLVHGTERLSLRSFEFDSDEVAAVLDAFQGTVFVQEHVIAHAVEGTFRDHILAGVMALYPQ
eukprot:PhM_4_TR1438/c0_g1_i1/m.78958